MTTIYKYDLPDPLSGPMTIRMPEGKPCHIGLQHGGIKMWCPVDGPDMDRTFCVVGTGHEFPEPSVYWTPLGSIIDRGFVWHVWELTEDLDEL